LAFAHDDRGEAGVAITRDLDLDWPISVSTVFVRVPLREFPPSRPVGSWRS
jgi:hypothetical protein